MRNLKSKDFAFIENILTLKSISMTSKQFYISSKLFVCISLTILAAITFTNASEDWSNHGGNILNRRYADSETKISPQTASSLSLRWRFEAGRDISATPAIYNDTVYFPSWNGNIYAVKASDGTLVWQKNLEELTGLSVTVLPANVTTIVSKATPTIADDKLIIGICGPAVVITLDRATGNLIWSTRLDNHFASIVTMSGTYHNGGFYVGTSSLEEGTTLENCCTFRGSLIKLNVQTGEIIWKTFMLPDNDGTTGGYAGAAIWGSSPSIDVTRNHVYIATGNLYSVPQRIAECQEQQNNQTTPSDSDNCIEPDNHSNSIMAFDLDSGNIKWYKQLGGYDVWIVACLTPGTPNCPPGPNPDADFGEAPMVLSINADGTTKDLVVAVQKSGFAWALYRDNGSLAWSTEAGPGGIGGGGTWGAATDEKRVYTNIANSNRLNYVLIPSGQVINGGAWVAMNAGSGKILWSTAVPNSAATNPVTIANGVLFAGSTYSTGPVYAIDAETGNILWSYETGATVFGGMSVSEGCIYVGHGYRVSAGVFNPSYTAGTSLFAFCTEEIP